MILPDTQDAAFTGVILPDARFGVVDTLEDRILGFDDAHKTVLIFSDAIRPALFLLLLIESEYASAKA